MTAAALSSTAPTFADWTHARYYDTTRIICTALFTLGFSFRIAGQKNMPTTGPALVIANHGSYFDPPLVTLATGRELVPLARKTLFRKPFFAALIRSLNAIPIDQEGIGKEGIRAIAEQVRLGRAVLVFPEGLRTPTGTMQPFRPGVHLLLKKAPAPIVPVGIAGAYDAWPVWRKYPIPAPLFLPAGRNTIAVAVGKPLDPRPYAEMPREESMRALSEKVQEMVVQAEELRRR